MAAAEWRMISGRENFGSMWLDEETERNGGVTG
jgi:hypothetical protein